MELIKQINVDIFIGILNVLAYICAYIVNVCMMSIWDGDGWKNKEVHPGEKFYSYCYEILYLVFIFIMITVSISLIRGVIKKSVPLIAPWLVMSFCMLLYSVQFLFKELIFWISFDHTQYNSDIILYVLLIFGIELICFKRIFGLCTKLFIQDLQQYQNSLIGITNYHRNLTQNDPSILQPLNLDEEFEKHYINSAQVNLTKFEI